MNPYFEIEELTASNFQEALACASTCFPDPGDQEFLTEHWNRVIHKNVKYFCQSDQDHLTLLQHFVYRKESCICAFGGLYQHDRNPERRWLNWFGVLPAARRAQLGSSVIRHLSAISRRDGGTSLIGYTTDAPENEGTCRFYESLGFRSLKKYQFRGEMVRLYELNL